MTKWYVKELSNLTKISVQTLHYYDRIGLLKPSLRQDNGYRLYSETDLLKLQQIIALKFFSFELAQIKAIVADPKEGIPALKDQVQILEQKAKNYAAASDTLNGIIHEVADNGSIPWETVIKSIEVYHMTEQLEHSWVKEIFTPEELKEYATFEAQLKANATPKNKSDFEKSWQDLIQEIADNLETDPKSKQGILLGKKLMDWVNTVYGKEYAHLRTKKFEKGFGEGKGLDDAGMTPEIVQWMEKSMDAYWRDRIYRTLDKVGKAPNEEVSHEWTIILDDMYGNEEKRKQELVEVALNDDGISDKAKAWLKSL